MKINNYFLLLTILCVANGMHAATNIFIRNEYRKPIIVNLDGFDVRELQANGDADSLSYIPKQIKIKAKGSFIYHSGIQEELKRILGNYFQNPNNRVTITILDNNNPLATSFQYRTDIIKQQPDKLAQLLEYYAQQQQQQEILPPTPAAGPEHIDSIVLTQQFLDGQMDSNSLLDVLKSAPFPYGQDCANKIIAVSRNEQKLILLKKNLSGLRDITRQKSWSVQQKSWSVKTLKDEILNTIYSFARY